MKIHLQGLKYEIDDTGIKGICKVCKLPILKSENQIPDEMDVSLWFDLSLDVSDDLHEMCDMDPEYFLYFHLRGSS